MRPCTTSNPVCPAQSRASDPPPQAVQRTLPLETPSHGPSLGRARETQALQRRRRRLVFLCAHVLVVGERCRDGSEQERRHGRGNPVARRAWPRPRCPSRGAVTRDAESPLTPAVDLATRLRAALVVGGRVSGSPSAGRARAGAGEGPPGGERLLEASSTRASRSRRGKGLESAIDRAFRGRGKGRKPSEACGHGAARLSLPATVLERF